MEPAETAQAPLIKNNNNIFNKDLKEDDEPIGFIDKDDNHIYQIEIKNNNNRITIICKNTCIEEEIYSCELTKDDIMKNYSIYTISNFIGKFKKKIQSSKIEEKKNYILFHALLDDDDEEYAQIKLFKNFEKVKTKNPEVEEIKLDKLKDSSIIIKNLIKENNNLKKENKKLKNEIDILNQKFQNYITIMNLNCFYNSFDTEAYKLEDVFKKIPNYSIIKHRNEFGLINRGIKYLYNSNIIDLKCEYKTNNEENNIELLKNIIKNTEYLLIVILTKDNKKFGVFQKIDINTLQNNNNMNQKIIIENNNNMDNYNNLENKFEFKNFYNKINNNNLEYKFENDNIMDQYNNIQNNNNMNQYYNNNMNQFNNNQDNIFISNSSLDGFAFLFDNLKNFYYNEGTDYKPIFAIFYDNNRESLYGTETINSQNNQYQLSGKSEFNIKNFEVYNLKISRIKN